MPLDQLVQFLDGYAVSLSGGSVSIRPQAGCRSGFPSGLASSLRLSSLQVCRCYL